jgi:glycosyltransferase involved in cell wall biosynthesis
MNLLISAFACAPGLGSEHGQGWNVAQQAARKHRVWVLTDEHCRGRIEASGSNRAEILYVSPRQFNVDDHGRSLNGLYYLAWQVQALRVARQLHRQIGFDLVHHVTYGSAWMPSFMGYLGIPFVIRAGAKEHTPAWYYQEMCWDSRFREASRSMGLRLIGPFVEAMATRKASAILSSSARETWNARLPVREFATGGLSSSEIELLGRIRPRNTAPFRIASIGSLTGWKAVSLGIRAFSRLSETCNSCEYWIIGDGKERPRLENLAASLQGRDKIKFLGQMTRADVFRLMEQFDVLLHPALHEEFGFAVLEAMAAGKPVICLDIAGPPHIVSGSPSMTIKPRSLTQTVSQMAIALEVYAADRSLVRKAGEATRAHAVDNWNWNRIGDELLRIYAELLPPFAFAYH